MNDPLRIGTRGSPLALWQANHVAEQLRAAVGERAVELVIVQTLGDVVQNRPLSQIGGDGLFTKAIQDALLDGRADVAVHSLKDLPTAPVPGLTLAAVPPRAPTRDAFLSRRFMRFDDLPIGATVATGSLRRRAQMWHRRPDLNLVDIRGNIDSRIRKLDEPDLDALVLAQAGLERLGLAPAITELLDDSWMLPAVGQGALGLECRTDDAETTRLLRLLDDRPTHQAVAAERAFLLALGGGCLVPIGARGVVDDGRLTLRGAVMDSRGRQRLDGGGAGPGEDAEEIGRSLARELLDQGAGELIREYRPNSF